MSIFTKKSKDSIQITPLNINNFEKWFKKQPKNIQEWIKQSNFSAKVGGILVIPRLSGGISEVIFGEPDEIDIYSYSSLPRKLPYNKSGYYINKIFKNDVIEKVALGWALECYSFNNYKKSNENKFSPLVLPEKTNKKKIESLVNATYLVRDLINTPANDMGPAEIVAAAKKIAKGCKTKVIVGKNLLKENFPTVFAVGKGSSREPRVIEFTWGNPKHPKVTLVGKGVAFDTGGLHLKTGNGMNLMKKDMGGAAHILGIAKMVIENKLPICLRVIIPAVENSVSGESYRPGDIIKTRKGITVEIGNTDAEGRLILADALALASEGKPNLIIDFATLTGAARVALGPDLPPLFSNNDELAIKLQKISHEIDDPMWHMPLWKPYNNMLKSDIADTDNVSSGGFAGAITAALFLKKFVDDNIDWIHIDTFGWNQSSKPSKPVGGEALGMRAVYKMLEERYKK